MQAKQKSWPSGGLRTETQAVHQMEKLRRHRVCWMMWAKQQDVDNFLVQGRCWTEQSWEGGQGAGVSPLVGATAKVVMVAGTEGVGAVR